MQLPIKDKAHPGSMRVWFLAHEFPAGCLSFICHGS